MKQEGALALLDAALRYRFDTKAKFLTYAYPAVKAAMLDYAATASLTVKLPPSRYHQIGRVSYLVTTAPPGTEDIMLLETICTQTCVSKRVARGLLRDARELLGGVRLGDGVFQVSCGGNSATRYTAKLRRKHIDELLETLMPRERTLVRKYCGFDNPNDISMTFEELAVRFNFNSTSAVEKAFKKAVAKLRDAYGKMECYGIWREAEKAFNKVKQDSAEPESYSTPQRMWYEDGWSLQADLNGIGMTFEGA